ncbi:MAG: DNA translocase FtsK [Ruminococcaceae bacterium]|nr:DNA translocase FtsK [Oscillospiraceae bacterium]
MAKKKLENELKKKGRSTAKKAVKGAARDVKKEWKDANKTGEKQPVKQRKTAYKILPYVFIIFALILAVCLVIVHALEMEDGAGVIGYGIQWFFGGLLGGGMPLLPLVLGFIGIKWCLYNVKWKEIDMSPSSENFRDYKKAKKRLMLQAIMAFLVCLTVSMIFGVIEDYGDIELVDMWQDSAEELFLGGGVIGSTLGTLMVMAFETAISLILLIILLLLFTILALGFTPDYIISKIQENRERRREERMILAEQERDAEEQRRLEAKKAAAAAAAAAAVAAKQDKLQKKETAEAKGMSAEDIADITEDRTEPTAEEIPIRPAANSVQMTADPVSQMLGEQAAPAGKDYGGEPGFDSDEYDSLDDIFKAMNQAAPQATSAPAPTPSEETPAAPLNLSELGAEELLSDLSVVAPEEGAVEEEEPVLPYVFPPIDLLAKNKNRDNEDHTAELQENARQLVNTLQSFKINIKEITYSRGPTITRYELKPEAGVRVRSIANLVDDIALSLATSGVRIEAPIPGKPAVGIEVPNRNRATVYLRDLIDNPQFSEAKSKLTASLGMDVGGNPIYFDITKMPHMIIAGATGMGKSVCINCVIMSILYKARPEDVKLILIDPKKVEFALYRDIPHLYAPIVSEPKKAAGALASAVAEMERRFELIEEVGVRDITSYNAATENDPYKEHMPHMVIIIDELADLMMTAPDEVESSICRLAQKARAAGIHIIIGTQRPSVDVITGLIKANIPSRIACTVASQVDSRTIIDIAGAEKLIGRGDMLFAPVGAAKPLRVQGAFVTETEVENIVTFIKENNSKAKYNAEFINRIEEEAAKCGMGKKGAAGGGGMDALPDSEGGDSKFHDAVKLAVEEGKISTSLMQRRLGVGYGRAAKIIDTMEQMGYVSKPDGNKPRRVLLTAEEYSRRVMDGTLGDSED